MEKEIQNNKIIDNTSKIEQVRHRRHMRRLQICIVICLLLAVCLTIWLTGLAGASVSVFSDIMDTTKIMMSQGKGFPVNNTVEQVVSSAKLSNSIAVLGQKELTVFSKTGSTLLNVQHGYANPKLSSGKTRICIYNQSGTQLIVTGRVSELYTKTFTQSILFAKMSANGTLGVVTKSETHKAQLTVFSPEFEETYIWKSAEDYPLCMDFSNNNKNFAVGCINTVNGNLTSTVYLLKQGETKELGKITRDDSMPIKIKYLSASELLVIYDNCAVIYNTDDGKQKAVFAYPAPLITINEENADVNAFIFGYPNQSNTATLVLLDKDLNLINTVSCDTIPENVYVTSQKVYVLCFGSLRIYDFDGIMLSEQTLDSMPLSLVPLETPVLITKNQLLQL